jgi:hypothetical protein
VEQQRQEDFAVGLYSHNRAGARGPASSLRVAEQVIVGPDGALRGRGRVVAKNGDSSLLNPIFAWAGELLPGHREIWLGESAGTTKFNVVDPAGGALSTFDVSPFTTVEGAAVVHNALIMASANPVADGLRAYAGSIKAANFVPANCAVTQDSRTVTRAAGGFNANVDVGMILELPKIAITDSWQFAVVQKVVSDTQLLLDRPWPESTSAAITLTFRPVLGMNNIIISPAKWIYPMTILFNELGLRWVAYGGVPADTEPRPTTMSFNNGPDPVTGLIAHGWDGENRHNFPPEATGIALQRLRDREMLFTKHGIYIVSNMNLDITDLDGNPQHPIEEYSRELIAVTNKGIATWQNTLIVPCRDEIYMIDGISPPVAISAGIPWAKHVSDGAVIGWAAVHRGYYLLPLTVGGETFTYVIRLAPAATPSGAVFFPTTKIMPSITGSDVFHTKRGKNVKCWTSAGSTSLLCAGETLLSEATGIFDENVDGHGDDSDGVNGSVVLAAVEKWFEAGSKTTVRRVRVKYRMVQGDFGASTLAVSVFRGESSSFVFATPNGGDSDGDDWVAFDVNAMEGHSFRVRVAVVGGTPKVFELRGIELQYRSFGGGF